jgi:predicted metal-dependent phosphotriesterase family hydrolase
VVEEIFALVQSKDAVLATGHVSAAEHFAVIKAFARRGKVLVTHAGEALAGPQLTPVQCRELADLGATIELTALSCQTVRGIPGKSPLQMAEMITTIGHERCVLATDYGWSKEVPKPAPGLRDFITALWEEGIPEEQITRMVSANPARLLAIEV